MPESSLDIGVNTKMYIRTYTPNEYILRFHNMDDIATNKVTLWDDKTKLCTILNQLSGQTDIKVAHLEELLLTTTRLRSEMTVNQLDPEWPVFNPQDGIN